RTLKNGNTATSLPSNWGWRFNFPQIIMARTSMHVSNYSWAFGPVDLNNLLLRTSLSVTNSAADFLVRVIRKTGIRKSPADGFRTRMSERALVTKRRELQTRASR